MSTKYIHDDSPYSPVSGLQIITGSIVQLGHLHVVGNGSFTQQLNFPTSSNASFTMNALTQSLRLQKHNVLNELIIINPQANEKIIGFDYDTLFTRIQFGIQTGPKFGCIDVQGRMLNISSSLVIDDVLNVVGNSLVTGSLNVSGSINMSGSLSIAPTHQVLFATGNNQQAGTAILNGRNPGKVTVANSLVDENSIIILTKQTLTNSYVVAISEKKRGTFTITSNGNGDMDTVGWFIINNSKIKIEQENEMFEKLI
jgi:hypothetical protein